MVAILLPDCIFMHICLVIFNTLFVSLEIQLCSDFVPMAINCGTSNIHHFVFKKSIFATLISPDRPLAIPLPLHRLDFPGKDCDCDDRDDINQSDVMMKI